LVRAFGERQFEYLAKYSIWRMPIWLFS